MQHANVRTYTHTHTHSLSLSLTLSLLLNATLRPAAAPVALGVLVHCVSFE